MLDHREWLMSHDLNEDQLAAANLFYSDWEAQDFMPVLENYIVIEQLLGVDE